MKVKELGDKNADKNVVVTTKATLGLQGWAGAGSVVTVHEARVKCHQNS